MRSRIVKLVVLLIGLMLVISVAPVLAQQNSVIVENTNNGVHIRDGAGTQFNSIAQFGWPAEQVTALGINADGSWVQIERGGIVGWVSRRYLLEIQGDIDSLPVVGSEPIPDVGNPAIFDNECYEGGWLTGRCQTVDQWEAGYYLHLLLTGQIGCDRYPQWSNWALPAGMCVPVVAEVVVPLIPDIPLELPPLPPIPPMDCAAGAGLRLIVSTPFGNQELVSACGFLRDLVANQWRANLDALNQMISNEVRNFGISDLEYARSSLGSEGNFSISGAGNSVTLRWQIPDNSVRIRIDTPIYVPTDAIVTARYSLDIVTELLIETRPTRFTVINAFADASEASVEGNFVADVANFFYPSTFRRAIRNINTLQLDLSRQIGDGISNYVMPFINSVPQELGRIEVNVDANGNLTIVLIALA